MARSTVGLDIGTSAVRAAELRRGDPPSVTRFAQVALPPGAISGGEINDEDAVASVLRDLWKRGGFRRKAVAVAVATPAVVVRQVDVPRLEENELRDALQFQVQDYIPMAIEDALLDYLVLEEFLGEENAQMLRLLVVAAHRELVGKVVRTLERAGLEPREIELAPLAVVRAIVDVRDASPMAEPVGGVAIVDIGAGVTSIVVHERGEPRFVRILATGGIDLTAVLVQSLGITAEDAEMQKSALGLPPEGADLEPGPQRVLEERARTFIEELRVSLSFYATQPGAREVTQVLLTGGGSLLPGLRPRLAAALGVPVEAADALGRVELGDLGLSPEQLEHVRAVGAVAIGLGLED